MHTKLISHGAALLVLLGAVSVRSQPAPSPLANSAAYQASGSITGSLVKPAQGKTVEGLTAMIVENGETVRTDKYGQFTFSAVRPGTYTILVTGDGYSRLRITDAVVQPNHTLELGAQAMPMVVRAGEVQMMEEVVVSAKKDIETLAEYTVNENKVEPYTDSNVDLPRTIDDAQPYYMLNSQSMQDSGSLTLEDYMHTHLTMNTTMEKPGQITADFGGDARGNAPNINLGGLSSSTAQQTLLLVDGHAWAQAVVSSGVGYQADINGIPISAVDHIEVLPSSAAAEYGPNALGGAINIVLKRDYSGGEIDFLYDNAVSGFDAPTKQVEGNYGFSFDNGKGHVMLTGSYSENKGILLQDRIGWENTYFAQLLKTQPTALGIGGSNATFGEIPTGTTPNIYLAASNSIYTNPTSTTLTLKNGTPLNSLYTYIPTGISSATPAATLGAGLLANAGQDNLNYPPNATEYGLDSQIGQAARIKSFGVNLRFDVTSKLTVFADVNNSSDISLNPYTEIGLASFVPGNNPFNPFQQNVYVEIPLTRTELWIEQTRTEAVTIGGTLKLPFDWKAEGDYTWSASNDVYYGLESDPSLSSSAAVPFFNASNTTSDPFVDALANPAAVPLPPPELFDSQLGPSTSDTLEGHISGPLWQLWAGKPTLTLGAEHVKSGFHEGGTFFVAQYAPSASSNEELGTFGQDSKDDAVYGELDFPIVSPKNQIPAISALNLQLSARTDYYHVPERLSSFTIAGNPLVTSAFANPGINFLHITKYLSTNPTIALSYKPIPDIELRGSYGTAFLPPFTSQLVPNPVPSVPSSTQIFDPVTGKTYSGYRTVSGGNPDLKPVTDHTWDFGAIYEPVSGPLKGLRADVELQMLTEDDVIATLTAAQIAADPVTYGFRIVRDPTTGLITQINTSNLNLYYEKERSWNFSLGYQKETPWGNFDLSALGTWYSSLVIKKSLLLAPLQYAGYANSGGIDKLKWNAELIWSRGPWTAGWTTTYYGSYYQTDAPGDPAYAITPTLTPTAIIEQQATSIPSQIYHDVFFRYNLGKSNPQRNGWANLLLANTTISVGLKDAFNTAPPLDMTAQPPGVSLLGSLYGREYWIQLKRSF